ncbi:hypothetical protein E2C01_050192 [Portunus trituberculatus]|uniref:Uncharacterized protein n=1 Tax=Portunus trituberculatus TaxID=210409 RepID=A0A5B7GFE5_PORTR|nr:hypothetical protein [Portunus trituberculatus]
MPSEHKSNVGQVEGSWVNVVSAKQAVAGGLFLVGLWLADDALGVSSARSRGNRGRLELRISGPMN